MTDDLQDQRLAEVLAEHEPVIGVTSFGGAIVGCSCLSARDYRAAGHQAGQVGYRAHIVGVLAARSVRDDPTLRDLLREGIASETQPCSLDHNGDCQEHGWFGGECWVAKVRAVLAEHAPADDESDVWCREESCRHRHWQSGDMPTHRRGSHCPAPADDPTRQAAAQAWEKGYVAGSRNSYQANPYLAATSEDGA